MSRRWEHIRGVLILGHILAICLMALPAPQGGMRKDAWKEATVQDEIAALSERLDSFGYETTPEELEVELWELATNFIRIRKRVLSPFQPYAKYAGTQQSWRMFVAPHRYPARLHIEIKRPEQDWETICVFQHPLYTWKAELLEHDRFRSALFRYGWKSYGGARKLFNEWLARQAAMDFPEATHIRTRWYKYKTPSPEEVLAGEEPEGRYILSNRLDLDTYREAQ